MQSKILMIAATLALCACQPPGVADGTQDPSASASLDPGTHPDPAAAEGDLPRIGRQAGDSLRQDSRPFHLDSARIEKDSLAIYLTWGGGCAKHEITLYLSDYEYISEPPGLDLWIHHAGEPDYCLALFFYRKAIPLEKLRPAYPGGFILINRHPADTSGALRVQLPPACKP